MKASEIIALISVIVATSAVIVSALSARFAARAPLVSVYFSTMVGSYGNYLDCVAQLLSAPGAEAEHALASALYKLPLIADKALYDLAVDIYLDTVKFSRTPHGDPAPVNEKLDLLQSSFQKQLYSFQKTGKHPALEQKRVPTRLKQPSIAE